MSSNSSAGSQPPAAATAGHHRAMTDLAAVSLDDAWKTMTTSSQPPQDGKVP